MDMILDLSSNSYIRDNENIKYFYNLATLGTTQDEVRVVANGAHQLKIRRFTKQERLESKLSVELQKYINRSCIGRLEYRKTKSVFSFCLLEAIAPRCLYSFII